MTPTKENPKIYKMLVVSSGPNKGMWVNFPIDLQSLMTRRSDNPQIRRFQEMHLGQLRLMKFAAENDPSSSKFSENSVVIPIRYADEDQWARLTLLTIAGIAEIKDL